MCWNAGKITRVRTVPQLFIGGEYIGGSSDVQSYDTGTLDMVARARIAARGLVLSAAGGVKNQKQTGKQRGLAWGASLAVHARAS